MRRAALACASGVRRSKWSTGPFRSLRETLLTHWTRSRYPLDTLTPLGRRGRTPPPPTQIPKTQIREPAARGTRVSRSSGPAKAGERRELRRAAGRLSTKARNSPAPFRIWKTQIPAPPCIPPAYNRPGCAPPAIGLPAPPVAAVRPWRHPAPEYGSPCRSSTPKARRDKNARPRRRPRDASATLLRP
jgi:hypothetical protein